MHTDRFWNLLSKHLAGEASAMEVAELETLIKAHPDLSYPAQHLTDLWKLPPVTDAGDAGTAFTKLAAKLESPPALQTIAETSKEAARPQHRQWLVILAATVAAILLARVFWPLESDTPTPASFTGVSRPAAEVSTQAGNRTRLVLPDSSVVWLNAGSKLTYDYAFGTTNRNTTLSGEAFFDVKKGTLPFVIKAHGVQVRVLGTAFNVKSYPDEERTETSLVRGRVEITLDQRPGEKFILKPNEKLSILNRPAASNQATPIEVPVLEWSQLTKTPDHAVLETAWVQNKLIFQDETLAEVARKMERWYAVHISIADPSLATLRVGGGPFEMEGITEALEALQIAFDFRFTKKENEISITR